MQGEGGLYLIEKRIITVEVKPSPQRREKDTQQSTLYDSKGVAIIKLFYGQGNMPLTDSDGKITKVATLDMILRGNIRFQELDRRHISTVFWLTNKGYKHVNNYLEHHPSDHIITTRYGIEVINKYHIVLYKRRRTLTIDTALDTEKVPKLVRVSKIVNRDQTNRKVIKPERTTPKFNLHLYESLKATYSDLKDVFSPSG